jgi:4-amino-4-deoxy-L-arabinose transferase-like glycosyltransferase
MPVASPGYTAPDQPRGWSVYWTLALIVAVGAGLRLYQLDAQSLWHDEAISLTVAREPITDIPGFFRSEGSRPPFEYNPPVYSYLLHAWLALTGVGGFEARLLSALAGVAALPVLFLLVRRIYDDGTGLLAAALLAVSQLGVMFSQEARHYEVFLLFVLTTVLAFWIAMTRRSLWAWCACTVSAVLMVGTQYYGAFVILALAAFTILYWRSIPWTWVAGSALAGAAVLVPWLWYALAGQMQAASDRVQPAYFAFTLSTLAGTINRFSNGAMDGLHQSTPVWTFPIAAVLFGVPIIYLAARAWLPRLGAAPPERRATVFILLLWAIPLACVFILGLVLNVQYNVRYAAFAIAPYYVLVAAGLARLPHRAGRALAVVLIVGYSGAALHATYRVPYKENYRDAIALINTDARSDDCFAFVPFGGPPLEWSIYGATRPARRLTLRGLPEGVDCPRTWVLTYHRVSNPGHARWSEALLAMTAAQVKTVDRRFFWVRVERYDARRPK